ncbi:MAG: site-specific DNA-methyltransferase [Ignavibacteria bacterium]|nr:site-specific DNA-methyltransferase [Ignavibacteria bacterium]
MKIKAPRNKTVVVSSEDELKYNGGLINLKNAVKTEDVMNKIINQDLFEALKYLPSGFVDLLILDPPYNLSKKFNVVKFNKITINDYSEWIEKFIVELKRTLKPDATVYFCSDWNSSTSVHLVMQKYFKVQNRITWEREKGRGSKTNWKNNSEDIWFCTCSNNYTFNIEDVKMKRKVIAPYRTIDGDPKDWLEDENGSFRITYPSNIWNDISVPFWSMKENTEHPTQKPEKLIAKLILASSNKGDVVLDPFMGSGTSAVTAKKLGRNFVGIEIDKKYCFLAAKRIEMAENDIKIQGYKDGIFWERNSSNS